MGANEKLGAAMHGATPLDNIKRRLAAVDDGEQQHSLGRAFMILARSQADVPRLIAALEAVQKLPDLTDRVNGNPEFIHGWEAAKEEVKERINEALGEQ